MFSQVLVVFCAILVFEASFCICFPTDENLPKNNHIREPWEKDENESYQVILKSPSQVMKVEVVDEDGNSRIEEMELNEEEERVDPQEQITARPKPIQCNWRRLFKLYLSKRKIAKDVWYSRNRRKEIKEAFKVVCEHPEEAMAYALDLIY